MPKLAKCFKFWAYVKASLFEIRKSNISRSFDCAKNPFPQTHEHNHLILTCEIFDRAIVRRKKLAEFRGQMVNFIPKYKTSEDQGYVVLRIEENKKYFTEAALKEYVGLIASERKFSFRIDKNQNIIQFWIEKNVSMVVFLSNEIDLRFYAIITSS